MGGQRGFFAASRSKNGIRSIARRQGRSLVLGAEFCEMSASAFYLNKEGREGRRFRGYMKFMPEWRGFTLHYLRSGLTNSLSLLPPVL